MIANYTTHLTLCQLFCNGDHTFYDKSHSSKCYNNVRELFVTVILWLHMTVFKWIISS